MKLKNKNFTAIKVSLLEDVDPDNSLLYKKISYLYDDYKIKPLHLMLPDTNAYLKGTDVQTKWMYFLIEEDDLLKKYNNIWDKATTDVKKRI